jgi:uncharacterized protein
MMNRRVRRLLGVALVLPVAGLGLWWSSVQAADAPAAFRTATWDELVPRDWDPMKYFRGKNVGQVKEGGASELELMREMREVWDNAPTRADLDGAKVRLPGYVVPLEQTRGEIKEFLLVPYFGACIHSPPPPANQIVHVVLSTPKPLRTMDAVWTSGTLRTQRHDSPSGTSAYRLEGFAVEPYKAAER